jgi:hypothetical protein
VSSASAVAFVRHLRDLTRSRYEPVRDVAACPQVHWLSELPGEIHVETEAGPGEVLFSIPVIPISPPAALEEFDTWLEMRRWYRVLRSLADEPAHEPAREPGAETEEYELVLATGLLTVPEAEIRSHLLTTPVRVVVDPGTERADVILADRPTVLHDRELIGHLAEFRAGRVDWIHDAVHAGQGYGLRNSGVDVLRKWCAAAFPEPIGFREDWSDDAPGNAVRVRMAPALVLRPHGGHALLDLLDGMAAALESGAPVPPALEEFLDGAERPGRRLALAHARRPRAVGELLTALLSRGRRILVTTPDPAALRAALPSGFTGLCATPTTAAETRAALAARAADHDPARHDELLAGLEERLAGLREQAQDLRQRIEAVRAQTVYDLGPDYQGTVPGLRTRLAQREPSFGWLPLPAPSPGKGRHSAPSKTREQPPTPPPASWPPTTARHAAAPEGETPHETGLPPEVPVSRAELRELVGLLAKRTPGRVARKGQSLPEVRALPPAETVREMIEAERAAQARLAQAPMPELSAALAKAPAETLARLTAVAAAVASAFGELGLPPDPARWDERQDWAVRAVRDGLARRAGPWERVAELAPRAVEAERAARFVGGRVVVLPPLPEGVTGLAAARALQERVPPVRALRDHLVAGGVIRHGPFRPAVQKAAEMELAGATVDDEPPSTTAELDAILAEIDGRTAVHELIGGWQTAGVAFPADRPLAEAARVFVGAYSRLGHVRTVLRAVAESASLLFSAGLRVPLGTPEEWRDYTAALSSVRLRVAADQAAASLGHAREAVHREILKGRVAPELVAAHAALRERDAEAYRRALAGLAGAHEERRDQARCEELLGRIAAVHPALAELLDREAADPEWERRIEGWEQAWAWARAAAAFRERAKTTAELRLEESLREILDREADARAELTAERAWGAALDRGGIPAWLAPLSRVPEIVPVRPDPAFEFDAVIVDRGAEEDETALFLLWFAPRIIVTDDGGRLFDLLNEKLGPAGVLS